MLGRIFVLQIGHLCDITKEELAKESIANSMEKGKRKKKKSEGKEKKEREDEKSYCICLNIAVILGACVLSFDRGKYLSLLIFILSCLGKELGRRKGNLGLSQKQRLSDDRTCLRGQTMFS